MPANFCEPIVSSIVSVLVWSRRTAGRVLRSSIIKVNDKKYRVCPVDYSPLRSSEWRSSVQQHVARQVGGLFREPLVVRSRVACGAFAVRGNCLRTRRDELCFPLRLACYLSGLPVCSDSCRINRLVFKVKSFCGLLSSAYFWSRLSARASRRLALLATFVYQSLGFSHGTHFCDLCR